jgi:hypothetical protein
VRDVEQNCAPEADLGRVIEHELAISQSLDGRSVFDGRRPMDRDKSKRDRQMQLFT